jgi:hypothetical protein
MTIALLLCQLLQVVQALQSKQKNYTEFGAIIDRCRSIVNLYENCRINYIRRQSNRVAHNLAQPSRFITSPQILNSCPSYIEPIIFNEMKACLCKKKSIHVTEELAAVPCPFV